MDSETHDPIDLQTKELRYVHFCWAVDRIFILNVVSSVYMNKQNIFVPQIPISSRVMVSVDLFDLGYIERSKCFCFLVFLIKKSEIGIRRIFNSNWS